ncbi:hypothetical protein [Sphingobium sp. EM0848]|uniref:hypothetical protein n=1 Tax=Sphingobium sp. EM0848 TaxID=2743473 RepID=UPI00350E972A
MKGGPEGWRQGGWGFGRDFLAELFRLAALYLVGELLRLDANQIAALDGGIDGGMLSIEGRPLPLDVRRFDAAGSHDTQASQFGVKQGELFLQLAGSIRCGSPGGLDLRQQQLAIALVRARVETLVDRSHILFRLGELNGGIDGAIRLRMNLAGKNEAQNQKHYRHQGMKAPSLICCFIPSKHWPPIIRYFCERMHLRGERVEVHMEQMKLGQSGFNLRQSDPNPVPLCHPAGSSFTSLETRGSLSAIFIRGPDDQRCVTELRPDFNMLILSSAEMFDYLFLRLIQSRSRDEADEDHFVVSGRHFDRCDACRCQRCAL